MSSFEPTKYIFYNQLLFFDEMNIIRSKEANYHNAPFF